MSNLHYKLLRSSSLDALYINEQHFNLTISSNFNNSNLIDKERIHGTIQSSQSNFVHQSVTSK